jgi:hypothetical protein
MHFGMKNTLKSNRNHTPKQAHVDTFFKNHDVYIKKFKKKYKV